MLWRALIGSLVHPSSVYSDDESVDSVTGLDFVEWETDPCRSERIRRDPSLDDDTVDNFFRLMKQWAAGKNINAPDEPEAESKSKSTLSLGSLLSGFRVASAAPAQRRMSAASNVSRLSMASEHDVENGDDAHLGLVAGNCLGISHITRNRMEDTLYKFIRDQLAALGVIEVVGKRDDEESMSYYEEREESPIELSTGDGGNAKKTAAVDSFGTADSDDKEGDVVDQIGSDADVSGWKRREQRKQRNKDRRKRRTQYLQIQR